MLALALTAFVSALLAFGLGWSARGARAREAEATARARLEGLTEEKTSLGRELDALRSAHLALQEERFAEARLRAAAEAVANQLPELAAKLERATEVNRTDSARIATLEAELASERAAIREQRALLEESRVALADSFKALSADALRSNNQTFIELARSTFETLQEGAKGDLEARQKAVDQIVLPIQETLSKFDLKLGELETDRVSSYSTLQEQLRGLVETHLPVLRNETANLVKALRQPVVRGRYGEVQLKRVVEMAGMLDHCDFLEQESASTEEGRLRPDLVVKLPGGRNIVIDAKTPIGAYLEAIESTDEATQKALIAQHAQACRRHIAALGRKAYWDQFTPTPEFVVMFIPGEVFFSAALQEDPSLLECGVEEKVILATPTTLIALLRAVAYGWRQEKLAQSAAEIEKLGKEIYDRVCTLGRHWSEVGDRLGRAVEAYNSSTATLETRLMVSARRFRDLKVTADSTDIGSLKQIDVHPRSVQAIELLPGPQREPVPLFNGTAAR
jgi:DNA recombination protein RmuC